LRDSAARYRALVMATSHMVWRADANGEGFLVTPEWQELTGQGEDEASNLGWLKVLHIKDQERSERLWKQAMMQRRMYQDEFQVRTRDRSYRYLHVQAVPILAADGAVHEWIGAAVDITQERETALTVQRQRDELAHVARINTMGQLATSLAHELNQPLTAILSNAQAAQRFLAANQADLEDVREILKDIVKDNKRAGDVIRRIRTLVKKESLEFTPLDLDNVISDVALLVHSDAILHNVRLSIEINPGLPAVRGDKVQLQQVLLNLFLNAFDAMHDCPVNRREIHVRAEQDREQMLEVSVSDRGTGLRVDNLDAMFQPFYTTKPNGLGMGLSISRSIVEVHRGRLWAENNPHGGATFRFTLPMALVGSPTSRVDS